MPGPLAAQLGMYLGYVHYGVIGATLTGVTFVLPSLFMVLAIVWAYVHYGGVLGQMFLFFGTAGAFIFGSGLAIVPFLYAGCVHELKWLNNQQFLDAVAVAMITPGPVVITTGFIGYLVAAADAGGSPIAGL